MSMSTAGLYIIIGYWSALLSKTQQTQPHYHFLTASSVYFDLNSQMQKHFRHYTDRG